MMDALSETFLLHVHPDLARVMRAASQGTPFRIVYGIRTLAAEAEAVRTGHSHTMHSRHLPNAAGVSCAVDVVHLDDGRVDWAAGHEGKIFGAIAVNVLIAARECKVPVEWGGSWDQTADPSHATWHDWGHFQLPWAVYP